jgi:hypothetical protein
VDVKLGHVFMLMNTINTVRPMVAKAPVKPADEYAIGFDLSGHLGYQKNRDGGFTDSTGFIYGAEQAQFGDGGLKAKGVAPPWLADAVQAAGALAINAAALVTHDRDFSRVRSLRLIS